MTLLEKLQHKREQRRIWKPRKPKKIILTPAQKAQSRAAAEGIASAIQRHIDSQLAAEAEDQRLVVEAFQRAFSREQFLNASTVTIQYKPQEVQNSNVAILNIKPTKSSTPDD